MTLLNKSDIISGQHIVVFKDGVKAHDKVAWFQELSLQGAPGNSASQEAFQGIKHVYDMGSFQGLAGQFHREALEQLRGHPDVGERSVGRARWT